jgi:Transcriptional regulator, AbiEi antitoxin
MTRLPPTPRDDLLQRLTQGGGYITGHEASSAGIPSMTLTRLLESGEIERPQRGVYRLAQTDALPPAPLELLDLLEIQLRFPPARASSAPYTCTA